MHTFQVGAVYAHNFICDASLHVAYRVVRRTAKSIWLEGADGTVSRRAVKASWDGSEETCYPDGTYSMCPILGAEKALPSNHALGPWSTGMGA